MKVIVINRGVFYKNNFYDILFTSRLRHRLGRTECGVGLVVEHVLAKDETGVRFSYAAQNKLVIMISSFNFNAILV